MNTENNSDNRPAWAKRLAEPRFTDPEMPDLEKSYADLQVRLWRKKQEPKSYVHLRYAACLVALLGLTWLMQLNKSKTAGSMVLNVNTQRALQHTVSTDTSWKGKGHDLSVKAGIEEQAKVKSHKTMTVPEPTVPDTEPLKQPLIQIPLVYSPANSPIPPPEDIAVATEMKKLPVVHNNRVKTPEAAETVWGEFKNPFQRILQKAGTPPASQPVFTKEHGIIINKTD